MPVVRIVLWSLVVACGVIGVALMPSDIGGWFILGALILAAPAHYASRGLGRDEDSLVLLPR